jgi:hypothetical protein
MCLSSGNTKRLLMDYDVLTTTIIVTITPCPSLQGKKGYRCDQGEVRSDGDASCDQGKCNENVLTRRLEYRLELVRTGFHGRVISDLLL